MNQLLNSFDSFDISRGFYSRDGSSFVLRTYLLEIILVEDRFYVSECAYLQISDSFEVKLVNLLILEYSFVQTGQIQHEISLKLSDK